MSSPKAKKIFLGFDFYGAGNIGDDLMLHGFIDTIKKYSANFEFGCVIPHNISSQKKRFPDVEWFPAREVNRTDILSKYKYWVGVGDTPFQMTSGPWLIDKILNDIQMVRHEVMPMYMIGVGGEQEALLVADKIKQIVNKIKSIWTRDQFTYELLIKHLGARNDLVFLGADLANLALSDLFSRWRVQAVAVDYDLAVTHYSELKNRNEYKEMERFLKEKVKTLSVIFVGNETRKGMGAEYDIYHSMFLGVKGLFRPPSVEFFMPDYDHASLEDLVKHFRRYKVVMSSRYHTLLTAAWAGCKIVALSRSSKINMLANELQIPLVGRPLSYTKLCEGFETARQVSSDQLKRIAQRAEESISALVGNL